MIMLAASPISVCVSFPVVAVSGLCFSARNGVVFNSAEVMEQSTELNVALFDKAGVFAEEAPHVIGLQSDVLDKKTFLNFLAHAVYYSDQPFAKAIIVQLIIYIFFGYKFLPIKLQSDFLKI
jgi:cation transport ATPase